MVLAERFPKLSGYLASLPQGLDSYPECTTKASLALSAFEKHDVEQLAEGLPRELAELVFSPPSGGMWIPAVWSDSIFHAMCDVFYPTEAAMRTWTRERTERLAANRLYRALLKRAGPGRFFRMSQRTHRLFQRGTEVETEAKDGHMITRMQFPPGLHNRLNLVSNEPALHTIVELTGGKSVRARMTEWSDVSATYECSWIF